MHPNARKVKYRADKALVALAEKDGFYARKSYQCCQSCAWAAASEEATSSNVVFYHVQDRQGLNQSGKLYLAWSGNAKKIVKRLEETGLKVTWDGDEGTRILCEMVE